MMRFLMIHTAGAEGSVALGDTEEAQAAIATEVLPGRSSSERLVPAVRRLMTAKKWRINELTAVVVVHGPGSFTGVRVGVSAAKGLSEAGAVPLIAVSRLALLAASVNGGEQRVHAVLDAGRGEFYYGEYVGRRCVREVLMGAHDVMVAASGCLVVVCELKVAEALAELRWKLVDEPLAGDALPFAVERVALGRFEDAATLDANYLRRIDMEIFAKPVARAAR
ncbi:tRNA (adenosine(37)-N6)-threonylcarbamoyltransferase complex dimerization subunit type 1 TsaB [Tunturiibacter empetritectus]|uniref:tRNA threonylcarbamoyladenosine biosynthesis protein TsaB n=2 Tax=Tunturiibacter TaxID=3154218 RepID=A0A852VGI5_9BACT|nr:tRNA (adenosine(37)-N6)-threonylcarbamoyltransferase complex dimerization subunit type 1 TsaB [Edaphobacter lichenicola]NYF90747.1 tRNA threonylcarbamoyladenosine biosynthesis protein TsaB [Edaphobacter lichenicola]